MPTRNSICFDKLEVGQTLEKILKKQYELKEFQKSLKENFKHNPIDLHNRSLYSNKDLDEYLIRFKTDIIRDSYENIDPQTYEADIAKSRLILFGDFHALDRSQSPLFNIVSTCNSRTTLLLECFKNSHNKLLTRYLDRKVDIDSLIEQSKIAQYWQYDLTQILEILALAKAKGMAVRGLSPDNKMNLEKRDHFAAEQIKKNLDTCEKVVVLIGESHLAADHLPKKLHQFSESTVRVVTNTDAVNWMILSRKIGDPTLRSNIFELANNFYSIQNASPWLKRISEAMAREESEQSIDSFNECGFDFEYFVVALCRLLGEKLGIKPPISLLENIHVHRDGYQELQVANSQSLNTSNQGARYDHHHIYMENHSISKLIQPIVDHFLLVCKNSEMDHLDDGNADTYERVKKIVYCCLDPIGVLAKSFTKKSEAPGTLIRPVRSKSTLQKEQAMTLASSAKDEQILIGLLNSTKLSEIGSSIQLLIKARHGLRIQLASNSSSKEAL